MLFHRTLASTLLLLGLHLPACGQNHPSRSATSVGDPTAKAATYRVAYGTDPQQFGELRLPAGKGPFPVVVVVHGGCWVAEVADLTGTTALATTIQQDGIATWNIEYRRLGNAGGGWPGTFLDVATAVDYVRTLALRYPLDTTRVVVLGHSAGGHLALWAASRSRLPVNSAVRTAGRPLHLRGAISLGGPADLRPFAEFDAQICGTHVITQLLGATPDKAPDRWHDASPAAMLPLGVPHRLIVGTEDGVVPADQARAYEQQARAAGDDARYLPVTNVDHMQEIEPTSHAWPVVRATVRELLGLPTK